MRYILPITVLWLSVTCLHARRCDADPLEEPEAAPRRGEKGVESAPAPYLAVSNGGLITYGYAARHPQQIDRILAIYPAVDFRSWPGLDSVVGPAAITPRGLSYGLSLGEMAARIEQFNPIDNLERLVRAGVPLLHIHGDADTLVPINPHSTVAVERYRRMGGSIELKVMAGSAHGGKEFFTDRHALEFLLAPSGEDDDD